jgi:hypothetical protein
MIGRVTFFRAMVHLMPTPACQAVGRYGEVGGCDAGDSGGYWNAAKSMPVRQE